MLTGINCLMFKGKSLSDSGREALYQGAKLCVYKEKKIFKVVHDDVRAEIYTDFNLLEFRGMTGMLFNAELDNGTKVKFLVNINEFEADEDGKWFSLSELIEAWDNRN